MTALGKTYRLSLERRHVPVRRGPRCLLFGFTPKVSVFCCVQVLECSWDELWNKVQRAQDLDHIIAAHDVFLDTIISRCLLDNNSRVSFTVDALTES